MEKNLQKFSEKISEIANNRTSGSMDMVKDILNCFHFLTIEDIGKMNGQELIEIISVLDNLLEKQRAFVSVNKLVTQILEYLKLRDLENMFKYLGIQNNIISSYGELLLENFLKNKIFPKTILLHSNSYSIKSFLAATQQNNIKIEKIFQTISEPGKEGVVQGKYLSSLGFNVEIIKSEEINLYINQIECGFFGADLILNNYIINKIKTKYLSNELKKAGKHVYILGDENKIPLKGTEKYFIGNALRLKSANDEKLLEKISKNNYNKILFPN